MNTSSIVLDGKVDGDDLSATVSGSFLDKNAGDSKSVDLAFTLSGSDVDNYEVDESENQTSITANINKKAIIRYFSACVWRNSS